MTTLGNMQFKELRAGMKFKHPEHGEQIILDLGRGQLGPAIYFHASEVYSGAMPHVEEHRAEENIFQTLARRVYPNGAEDWQYLGLISQEEVRAHGWQWFELDCPHCGFVNRLLAAAASTKQRHCHACGMVFYRPTEPAEPR